MWLKRLIIVQKNDMVTSNKLSPLVRLEEMQLNFLSAFKRFTVSQLCTGENTMTRVYVIANQKKIIIIKWDEGV